MQQASSWIVDSSLILVAAGTFLLAVSAAVVGSFTFLQKRSLVGDAVAHSILPGVAAAFLFSGNKDPWWLMLGALLSGWLSLSLMDFLSRKTKLSQDTAIATVLSVFFGVGILLLTYIQHLESGNQSGLDQFLFGQAAAMKSRELWIYGGLAVVLIVCTLVFFKEFKLLSFNPDFAQSLGLPVRGLRILMNSLMVLAIALGIQAVGVVLMAALLITPSAAARNFTDRLKAMIIIAALIAGFSALLGSAISFSAKGMPTGPWIVMCLSIIALLSLLLAPKKGMLARMLLQRRHQEKINDENLLKAFYHYGERHANLAQWIHLNDLAEVRDFAEEDQSKVLRRLIHKGHLLRKGEAFQFSRAGLDEARRVVRLHRLWEMYLSQRLRLKSDHIHPNAETMEHIISPEIEAQLLEELDYPDKDPHQSPIPYRS
ncbi:iron chelate uptake ABC transporter family permease subunit [Croceimicrobium sp.]|uniref:metal ABC transporter permease n=1 Tax=Croceimicrobium sp. TaxID=2828340 RepID=UPI003BADA66E